MLPSPKNPVEPAASATRTICKRALVKNISVPLFPTDRKEGQMRMQREDCIHPFDTGFIPKIRAIRYFEWVARDGFRDGKLR
jgi:hypothetical protein